MQRPPGTQTTTRPTQHQQQHHQSSPFAGHQRPALPPGMNIGQTQSASGAGSVGNAAPGAPSGAPGLPGGMGSRMGFPPSGMGSPAAVRSMGPAGYAARSGGGSHGNTGAGSYLFAGGGGGGGAGSYGQGQGGGNLDMSDFPALGSAGAGVNQGQTSSLASTLNNAASRGGAASSGQGSGFTSDDFPALGAPSAAGGMTGGPQHFANGSQAQSAATAAAAAAAAEQASAAAALQHQASQREAHRLGMLSNVNGSPQAANRGTGQGQPPALNAARGGFGEMERNYATKLGSSQPTGMPALSTNTGGAQSWSQAEGGASNTNGTGARGTGPHPPSTTTPASQILYSPADRFGLIGLLRIIKLQAAGPGAGGVNGAPPEDVQMLALGTDLQTLGLDVGSEHPLYPDFHTPWSSDAHPLQRSQRSMVEPDFHLPSCYNVQPPPPAQTKVANFSDETLFFIFYSTPRDVLQEVAAMELHHRNWRFHKELQLWLTKEHNMEPTQKTPMYEKGQYVFWDVESWQRVTKNFVLLYELLEDRPALAAQAQAQQAQAMQQQQQQGGGPGGQAELQTAGAGAAPSTPSQVGTPAQTQAQPAGR